MSTVKMEKVFEKKKNRASIRVDDNTTIQVDLDDKYGLMPLVMNGMRFGHGEIFAEDGWVYSPEQKKVRKWFQPRQGWNHFWAPVENDVSRIERLHVGLMRQRNKLWKRQGKVIRAMLKTPHFEDQWGHKYWLGHAQPSPSHRYGNGERKLTWNLYKINLRDFNSPSFSHDWVHKPEFPINLKLGQELYTCDRLLWGNRRLGLVEQLLNDVICKHIKKIDPKAWDRKLGANKLYQVVINQRSYYYMGCWKSGAYFHLEKVSWPDDDFQKMELT